MKSIQSTNEKLVSVLSVLDNSRKLLIRNDAREHETVIKNIGIAIVEILDIQKTILEDDSKN